MNGEISIGGVFMPTILLLAVIASVLTMILLRFINVSGLYRFVAYRALVDLCIYIMVLGALSLLAPHIGLHP
ncbi:DUF1656 domain-containing protein [Novosphingobium sp. P6W]|uniref:DUF1656 domain-containing protein n=1 Tax=Novosphingobium sp. P6W TaxID=1609758 RepID=UPI0005C31378|nr:DUF1656 domain-containing protein [Novosphingobium sp. P6W]AXB77223.1 DUF1656 domain-containing protein [Novosphingobium sp. P6W]KIS33622.1 hypothetical protein TQ38_02500 [Novosphingobium sp. P6W]